MIQMNNFWAGRTDVSATVQLVNTASMIQGQRELREKDEWDRFRADNSLISTHYFGYYK